MKIVYFIPVTVLDENKQIETNSTFLSRFHKLSHQDQTIMQGLPDSFLTKHDCANFEAGNLVMSYQEQPNQVYFFIELIPDRILADHEPELFGEAFLELINKEYGKKLSDTIEGITRYTLQLPVSEVNQQIFDD